MNYLKAKWLHFLGKRCFDCGNTDLKHIAGIGADAMLCEKCDRCL